MKNTFYFVLAALLLSAAACDPRSDRSSAKPEKVTDSSTVNALRDSSHVETPKSDSLPVSE